MSVLILLLLALAATVPANASDETLVIGTQQDLSAKMAEAVLSEAFTRCGISYEFRLFPHRRALNMANSGEIDGDLMRVPEIQQSFPNLVQVTTPVYYLKMFAFAKKEHSIQTPEDLRSLSVGIERGVLLAERLTEGMNVTVLDSQDRMMLLLDNDRLDIGVISDISGERAARKAGLADVVRPVGPALATKPLYFHLHKRHADLVPKLSETLQQMQDSGEADALRRECKRTFLK